MIRKVSFVFGFAALFLLGAPTEAFADSLPANEGQSSYGGYEGCLQRGFGISNTCSFAVSVLFPVQSRATGYWTFYATGPAGAAPDCAVYGQDFNGNNQFYGAARPNGRVSFGRFYVYSNTAILYACTFQPGQSLLSMDWNQ